MAKFTFTATAPNGETRTRKSDTLYTHATVRGGKVVSFHQSGDIARRAAARVRGTSVVRVQGCAQAEAFLADRRAAEVQTILANRDMSLGDQVVARVAPVRDDQLRMIAEGGWVVGELIDVSKPVQGFIDAVVRDDNGNEVAVKLVGVEKVDSAHGRERLARLGLAG